MADKLCPLMRAKLPPPSFSHDPRDPGEGPAPCIEHRCRWYIQLIGKHPQKDAPVEEWGCAMEFLPILLIENAQQTRQHAAAVESARNEARNDAAAVSASVVAMANEVGHMARAVAAPELPANHHSLELDARRTGGTATTRRPGIFARLALAFKGGS